MAVGGKISLPADEVGARICRFQADRFLPRPADGQRLKLPRGVEQMDAGQACGVVIGEALFPQSVIVCKRRTGKRRLGPDNADGTSR